MPTHSSHFFQYFSLIGSVFEAWKRVDMTKYIQEVYDIMTYTPAVSIASWTLLGGQKIFPMPVHNLWRGPLVVLLKDIHYIENRVENRVVFQSYLDSVDYQGQSNK